MNGNSLNTSLFFVTLNHEQSLERMIRVGVVSYVFFTYALTAVIAFAVMGLIVFINWLMSRNNEEEEMQ